MAAQTAPDLLQLVGESPPFLEMLEHASQAARLDRPVLVIGERGAGKELVAARLHYLSPRWQAPYVKLNCAALAPSLLESELFGHEAGAFTGATRARGGRFAAADTGTLFLDEIATAELAVQEKLLRVVEYGEFERLGADTPQRVNVRLIGATNRDLPAEAAADRFRADLLDRLSFDVITVPPLRDRGEDIPLLANHFARAMALELEWPRFPGFSNAALAALAAHPWPGNIRELKNVAERAVYRWPDPDSPIDEIVLDPFASPYRPPGPPAPDQLPLPEAPAPAPAPAVANIDGTRSPAGYKATIAAFERRLLEDALARARFNQRAAARDLALSYHQLRNAMKKHGLSAAAPAPAEGPDPA